MQKNNKKTEASNVQENMCQLKYIANIWLGQVLIVHFENLLLNCSLLISDIYELCMLQQDGRSNWSASRYLKLVCTYVDPKLKLSRIFIRVISCLL